MTAFRTNFGGWVLAGVLGLAGCVSEPRRTYEKEFVNTYAELTLLYERHKMERSESDSVYQGKVQEFFATKGLKQEEFKQRAEDLSQQPQVWKMFIGDVTAAIDSIKRLEQE